MSGFHDVSLPMKFALGAAGGPEWKTQITQLASGHEFRNGLWSGSRRRWDVGGGVQSQQDLETLTAFFEARQGRLHSFRFRDVTDWKSCQLENEISSSDQVLGEGDGIATRFALVKRYQSGANSVSRLISKPDVSSILLRVGGNELITGWHFDELNADIVLDQPPANGELIQTGFEFDLHARFDTDMLAVSLDHINAGRVVSAPIIELLN